MLLFWNKDWDDMLHWHENTVSLALKSDFFLDLCFVTTPDAVKTY